jgi:ABC-type nitrate/sulfonate/bicarbonate transport system permease component
VTHTSPESVATGSPRLRLARLSPRLTYGAAGFVLVVVVWELASQLRFAKRSLVSSPSLVVEVAWEEMTSGAIWPHIATSLTEWLLGFAIGLLLAIPLGLLLGVSRRAEALSSILLPAAYSMPNVAIVPLIILVAGIGLTQKVVVIVLAVIFPVIINTMLGAMSAERRYLDTARSFGASARRTLLSVVIPSTIPYILTGIRIAAGRALVGVVVAEFIAANQGIGFYVITAGAVADTSKVMFGLLLVGLFGVAVGELVRRTERRFDVWRPPIR